MAKRELFLDISITPQSRHSGTFMANEIFNALFEEQAETFISSFLATSKRVFIDTNTGKIYHTGEFGRYRETVTKDFLRFVIPRNVDIASGFIITSTNNRSTQCDIILFDKMVTPLYRDDDRQVFFPIETVCGIGEVKSTLSKSEFTLALNKLARNKALGEDANRGTIIKSAGRSVSEYCDVFSFLICKKLDFDISSLQYDINNLYDSDIQKKHKHNMILSIDDGVIVYHGANKGGINSNQAMPYPIWFGDELKNRVIKPADNKYIHLKWFCSYIFMLATTKYVFYPEFTNYIGDFLGGTNSDQL